MRAPAVGAAMPCRGPNKWGNQLAVINPESQVVARF